MPKVQKSLSEQDYNALLERIETLENSCVQNKDFYELSGSVSNLTGKVDTINSLASPMLQSADTVVSHSSILMTALTVFLAICAIVVSLYIARDRITLLDKLKKGLKKDLKSKLEESKEELNEEGNKELKLCLEMIEKQAEEKIKALIHDPRLDTIILDKMERFSDAENTADMSDKKITMSDVNEANEDDNDE